MKTTPHKPNNSEGRRERPVSSLLRSPESGAFFAVVVLSVVLTVLRQEFLSPTNLSFVARGFSFIAIAAMGMCFVIITGGIDLSIGSVMGLSGHCSIPFCQQLRPNYCNSAFTFCWSGSGPFQRSNDIKGKTRAIYHDIRHS